MEIDNIVDIEQLSVCHWAEDEDSGAYDTECGHTFALNDGTPAENEMAFCCYCGSQLA